MVVVTWLLGLVSGVRKWFKRAKWLKKNKQNVVLAVLVVALVIVTIGYLKARDAEKTLRLRVSELNATQRVALKHKDKAADEKAATGKHSTKTKTKAKLYDDSGTLVAELEREAEEIDEFNALWKHLHTRTPSIAEADPVPTGSAAAPVAPATAAVQGGLYPLGIFLTIDSTVAIGGGVTWTLLPRIKLPLLPDPALTIGGGATKTSDGIGIQGLAILGFNRN